MSDENVLSFEKRRQQAIEDKKRTFERVLFKDFLGCYTEIDDQGTTFPVKIIDISRDGLLFQVPMSPNVKNTFGEDKELTLRFYFSKESFLPLVVNIKHGKEHINSRGDAFMRYGGEFDKSLPSFEAMKPFIEFIYKFAEFSCVDHGENHRVYFL